MDAVSDATTGNLGDPGQAMAGLDTALDPAVTKTFNDVQQNGLWIVGPAAVAEGPAPGLGVAAPAVSTSPYGGMPSAMKAYGVDPSGDDGTSNSEPSSIDGTHALTIHGDLEDGTTMMSSGVPALSG